VLVEFVFEALPLVALPPLVFKLTLASPLDALWELLLVTVMQLSLLTCVLFLLTVRISLLENGPVSLIEALVVLFELPPAPPAPLLLTLTDVEALLLLLALPLVAPPALVFSQVLAEPLDADWVLSLLTPTLLLL
jgi:hypothetical protein